MNSFTIEEKIQKSTKGLPEDLLNEILDFIEFIKARKIQNTENADLMSELSVLDNTEAKHLEEEFINYKNLYP